MKPDRTLIAGPALIALALAGCTSAQPDAGPPRADKVCVKVRRIDSFTALNDRHVVVEAGVDDHYLLTVDRPCAGLAFATMISLAGGSSRVCDGGFDFLAYGQAGEGPRRCRIVRIEQVDNEQAARALIESRQGP